MIDECPLVFGLQSKFRAFFVVVAVNSRSTVVYGERALTARCVAFTEPLLSSSSSCVLYHKEIYPSFYLKIPCVCASVEAIELCTLYADDGDATQQRVGVQQSTLGSHAPSK